MANECEWINPDHYLQTPSGRVWTPERNTVAWEQAYVQLTSALAGAPRTLYLVCGLQGAGKSSWIEVNMSRLAPCVFFDAALPRAVHRLPAITIARSTGARARCVWMDTPLEIALKRNAERREDERVPESSIRSVAAQFEPPSVSEGFIEVVRVDGSKEIRR
jgi:predicted kinase